MKKVKENFRFRFRSNIIESLGPIHTNRKLERKRKISKRSKNKRQTSNKNVSFRASFLLSRSRTLSLIHTDLTFIFSRCRHGARTCCVRRTTISRTTWLIPSASQCRTSATRTQPSPELGPTAASSISRTTGLIRSVARPMKAPSRAG